MYFNKPQWDANAHMKKHETSNAKVSVICLIMSMAIFVIDTSTPLGVAAGVPYMLVVLTSLWSPSKKLIYIVAFSVSILTVLGIYSSPSGGELWKVLFNRAIALFAIWTTASLSMQRQIIFEEKEIALDEIKTLKGIIPICSYCHSIRDEEGAWDRVESYISKHSDAAFSHGICPKCMVKARSEAGLDEK